MCPRYAGDTLGLRALNEAIMITHLLVHMTNPKTSHVPDDTDGAYTAHRGRTRASFYKASSRPTTLRSAERPDIALNVAGLQLRFTLHVAPLQRC